MTAIAMFRRITTPANLIKNLLLGCIAALPKRARIFKSAIDFFSIGNGSADVS
jgi:hypothetical protein